MKCTVMYHFDVWGNFKDGYDINDSRRFEMEIDLASNRSMLKSLRKEFVIPSGKAQIIDDSDAVYINKRNGKPFLTIWIDGHYTETEGV